MNFFWYQAIAALTAVLGVVPSTVLAQTGQWSNAALLKRGVSNEQYRAIGKGDQAECKAQAIQAANASNEAERPCDTAMDPGMFYACQRANEARIERRDAAMRDVAFGCMARRGWIFKEAPQ